MTHPARTRWDGIIDRRIKATGFFHAAQIDGVWWLIDPDGGRFLSKGVTTVRFDPDHVRNSKRAPYAEACKRKYGSIEKWRTAAARRLLSFGFNSLGAWSDPGVARAGPRRLAVAPELYLGARFMSAQSAAATLENDAFPDVFDAEFAPFVRSRAVESCAAERHDAGVIGWFTDNELRWGPDWRGSAELLTMFLCGVPESAGRRAAIALLRERYASFKDFNAVWRSGARNWDELGTLAVLEPPYQREPLFLQNPDVEAARNAADPKRAAFVADCEAFVALLAERYFEATAAAVKAAAPHHMLLGPRFAYVPPRAVVEAAGRHLDVIAFNRYDPDPLPAIDAYARTGKPCLVGEFSFRGDDSGLPNTIGAGPRVPDQAERAKCFRHYVTVGLRQTAFVGYHWFEHADQPAEGRFDGENSNYGIVTINDDVYAELTAEMMAVNAIAEDIHAAPDERGARG
jgi:agarase